MGNKVVKLGITSDELLNKEFKGAVRGYDAFEVDLYLDKILKDYRLVESNYLMNKKDLDDLNAKIETLNKQIEELTIANESMKAKLGNISSSKTVTSENIDLLKRIDRLERFLWKLGHNPNKI